MSGFSISSTTAKKTRFSSLLLSDLFLFCAFVLSHPIYFFYFIFFSPYLLKLLSFLSPLFITTFLLLLALLTVSPNLVLEKCHSEFSESKVSFVLGAYHALVERLRSKGEDGDEKFHSFVELEAYKIVFETSNTEENQVEVLDEESKEDCSASTELDQVSKRPDDEVNGVGGVPRVLDGNLEEDPTVVTIPESAQLIAEGKSLRGFLHQKEKFEQDIWCQKVEQEVKPLSVNANKVDEQEKENFMRSGSKASDHSRTNEAQANGDDATPCSPKLNYHKLDASAWSPDNGGYYTPKEAENSETMGGNLGSFGSMRKEKEWRRTLACKLFEERHNVNGDEGMDMLWETYETDSIKVMAKSKTKKGKKGLIEYNDEEEDEEENNEQLCCLQALKFSAGKMNLGMGRPNIAKISKALKGIGWLHHVNKHGKKSRH